MLQKAFDHKPRPCHINLFIYLFLAMGSRLHYTFGIKTKLNCSEYVRERKAVEFFFFFVCKNEFLFFSSFFGIWFYRRHLPWQSLVVFIFSRRLRYVDMHMVSS